jgi:transposase
LIPERLLKCLVRAYGCLPPASQQEEYGMNSVGIDVGKKICRASIKDTHGAILGEFSFSNDSAGIESLIVNVKRYGDARAVVESTGNMWIRIHDALEDSGIDVVLANPVKTKMIAEAKIKSDRLDSRVLADLLRGDLVYESYVPSREFREKRSLVRHRVSLVRVRTALGNRIHALLDRYGYRSELSDIFGKAGVEWLGSLQLSPIDQVIMDTSIASIEGLDSQIDVVSREVAKYAWNSRDVRLLLSMNGVDVFSAMVIATEIVDIRRFATPWKLVSYAGLAPGSRESAGKTRRGRITKQGSKWLRWIMVQSARQAARHDVRFKAYYERIQRKKGDAKAIVAVAKEMLVVIWHMLWKQELYRGVKEELYRRKLAKLEKFSPNAYQEIDE